MRAVGRLCELFEPSYRCFSGEGSPAELSLKATRRSSFSPVPDKPETRQPHLCERVDFIYVSSMQRPPSERE